MIQVRLLRRCIIILKTVTKDKLINPGRGKGFADGLAGRV